MRVVERYRVDGHDSRQVPADDRGLAYGDGVFRTLLTTHGRPVAWAAHWLRLTYDCHALALELPSRESIEADLEALTADLDQAVVRITITRGSGGRGYTPPEDNASRRILRATPRPQTSQSETLDLKRSSIALSEQPFLAGVKHLNRLEQVWARRECVARGNVDRLMCDTGGRMIGTTMRNIIFVDADNRWWTPRISRAGVIGATRQRLIEAGRSQGLSIAIDDIAYAKRDRFIAAIACNSVGGVIPLARIDGHALPDSRRLAEYAKTLLSQTR